MKINFTGTGVAVITPFHKNGTIDFTSLGKILEHLISNDVDYIVAMGTTGEAATLSPIEKTAVLDFILETVNNRVPVVLGMGCNNTFEIIEKIKNTDFEGISAILSVSPYYNKPQQQGIYLHYKNISDVSPVPIIIYNVPGRTASNITAETTLRIAADMDNVIGIKEASGNMVQIMEIIRQKPKDFLVISGDDALTLPILSVGGNGVISVVANAFPLEFSKMTHYGLKGNLKSSMDIHYRILPIINALFEDGNPSGIKAALEILGLCSNNVRLPLVKINKALYNKISNLITDFKLLKF